MTSSHSEGTKLKLDNGMSLLEAYVELNNESFAMFPPDAYVVPCAMYHVPAAAAQCSDVRCYLGHLGTPPNNNKHLSLGS